MFEQVLAAFGLMRDSGMKTFGQWSDSEIKGRVRVYAEVLREDAKITPEIVLATAKRYAEGRVTVWKDGAHIPASKEFPTAPEFRDACLQTWHGLYRIVAIGERDDDGAKILQTRVERRDDPQPGVKSLDAPATEETKALFKSKWDALATRGDSLPNEPRARTHNAQSGEELAKLAAVRQKHEGVSQ